MKAADIESIVRTWPAQRFYEFWERVGIVSQCQYDDDSIIRVFTQHIEGASKDA